MTKIRKFIERIDDELDDARNYAEKYIECKARGKTDSAGKYHTMSEDELKHAAWLHEMAAAETAEIEKVFRPTEEMQSRWDESHRRYVEKAAWIRRMLEM